MKDKLITLLVGAAVFIGSVAVLALIASTGIGSVIFVIVLALVASYLVGWLIRDMWSMHKRNKEYDAHLHG